VIAQETTVLVVWETYAYSEEGQGIIGRRVFPDGTVSPAMVLEDTFQADPVLLEPHFDVHAVAPRELLIAIGASPYGSVSSSRLSVFRAVLPPEGSESSGVERAASWPAEIPMATIGYGAVSRPRFVDRGGGALQLGYVQTGYIADPVDPTAFAELAVFDLSASGALASDPSCPAATAGCCPAHTCHRVRVERSLAVGVVDAFDHEGVVTWVLDDARPSAVDVSAITAEEYDLPPLSVVGAADSTGVLLVEPSPRTGEKLPDSPVAGPARLARAAPGASKQIVAELPELRDTPRPAWVRRTGATSLLVSPGKSVDASSLSVFTLDEGTGAAVKVAEVPRFSSLPVDGVQAAVVGGKLFVVWFDQADEEAVIRAAVLDEPF
jgi:hypothetical protein